MNRHVTFISEFDQERDSEKGIIKKSLRLSWEHQCLIIRVWDQRHSSEHFLYLTESFYKKWDFNIYTIIDHPDYYPSNINPSNMRTTLEMASTCEKKAAEAAMYHAFYQLEIVPTFHLGEFQEGWLKKKLPTLWDYWAKKIIADREYDAQKILDE